MRIMEKIEMNQNIENICKEKSNRNKVKGKRSIDIKIWKYIQFVQSGVEKHRTAQGGVGCSQMIY